MPRCARSLLSSLTLRALKHSEWKLWALVIPPRTPEERRVRSDLSSSSHHAGSDDSSMHRERRFGTIGTMYGPKASNSLNAATSHLGSRELRASGRSPARCRLTPPHPGRQPSAERTEQRRRGHSPTNWSSSPPFTATPALIRHEFRHGRNHPRRGGQPPMWFGPGLCGGHAYRDLPCRWLR